MGWDSSASETLPREDADFDFSLIEPASVSGSVVNGEPVPNPSTNLPSEKVGQRLAVVDIEVIRDQMDGFRFRVLKGKLENDLGELKAGTIRRRERKAVPRRSYSLSRLAFRPGAAGEPGRTSACNVTGFSSRQTTGCSGLYGCSYVSKTSSIFEMYSSFSSGTVAVGTNIAARPPHRSVRAELPHTALALDIGVRRKYLRQYALLVAHGNVEPGSESGTCAPTRNSP
ncbi:MAG: hypothetical protein QOJ99_312 [Bryobacterales bacterium]|nr:hypothetical protein [Bryobacterales bacterium]